MDTSTNIPLPPVKTTTDRAAGAPIFHLNRVTGAVADVHHSAGDNVSVKVALLNPTAPVFPPRS